MKKLNQIVVVFLSYIFILCTLKSRSCPDFLLLRCRGYRTVAHGGSLWGHYTHFLLLPDIGLGLYSSINGVEGFPSAMQNIALFAGQLQKFFRLDRNFLRNSNTTTAVQKKKKKKKKTQQKRGMDV